MNCYCSKIIEQPTTLILRILRFPSGQRKYNLKEHFRKVGIIYFLLNDKHQLNNSHSLMMSML
jgi:hypothetical protein